VFASLRSFQVLEQVGFLRFDTENTPIIEVWFRFVSISLPLLAVTDDFKTQSL
jgi:hypothetical protein